MTKYTPSMNATGVFTLKPPFDKLVLPQVAYTCVALRSLAEIISSGSDPQEEFYTPNELDDAAYQGDVAAGAVIVTLQATGGAAIQVPDTYIDGFPQMGGVPYTSLMLTIKIGSVPDNLNLSVVKQKISDDVLELLGVQATTNVVALTPAVLIPEDQAKMIEAARQGKIGTVITDYTKYVQAQQQLEAAQQQIALLEEYIRTHQSSA